MVVKGVLLIGLLCVSEAASVVKDVQTANAVRPVVESLTEGMKSILEATTINSADTKDRATESQSLVALDSGTTAGSSIGEPVNLDSARLKARQFATDIQEKVDMVNYAWFTSFAIAFFASFSAFPAMELLAIRGAVGWSFWTAMIASCLYVVVMSVEFVSLHRFIKRFVVWGANLVIASTDSAENAANRIKERTNIDPFAVLNKLPNKATSLVMGSHIGLEQTTTPHDETQSLAQTQTQSNSKAISISSGLVDTITSVPFEQFPVQSENICESAWLSDSTVRITGDYKVYYNDEGPLDSWSPIARWNMRRLPHQKKIPNPSDCRRTPDGGVSEAVCPGHEMWMHGASSFCDCAGVLARLGYESEFTGMTSCVTSARDMVFRLFRSVLLTDATNAESRNADLFSSQRQTSCLTTFDVSQATTTGSDPFTTSYQQRTSLCYRTTPLASNSIGSVDLCVALCEANTACKGFDFNTVTGACDLQSAAAPAAACPTSYMSYVQSASRILPYRGSPFSDASALSDSYARISGSSGLQWVLSGCLTGSLTFDFRYSAETNVSIQVLVNQGNVTLSDNTNVLLPTGGKNQLMRGNFVVGPIDIDAGVQTIQISRLVPSNGVLTVHRMAVCSDGTSSGCPAGPVDSLYCYKAFDSSSFTTALTTFSGGASIASFPAALSACNARMDCSGVVLQASNMYVLMGGTKSTGSSKVYQRFIGVADNHMCIS